MALFDNYGLRNIRETDLSVILDWRNSDYIRMCMFNDKVISTEQQVEWYLEVVCKSPEMFKIFEYNGTPLGLITLKKMDEASNRYSWGFYLGQRTLPRGTGLILGYLGLVHAFEVCGIRKLIGEVLASNLPSLRLHQKLGFEREGYFKNHVWKNSGFEDVVSFSFFGDKWQEQKKTIKRLIKSKSQ